MCGCHIFLPEALHDERYFCILERFDPGSGDFSGPSVCPGNGLILPAYFPKTSIGWYNQEICKLKNKGAEEASA